MLLACCAGYDDRVREVGVEGCGHSTLKLEIHRQGNHIKTVCVYVCVYETVCTGYILGQPHPYKQMSSLHSLVTCVSVCMCVCVR